MIRGFSFNVVLFKHESLSNSYKVGCTIFPTMVEINEKILSNHSITLQSSKDFDFFVCVLALMKKMKAEIQKQLAENALKPMNSS